MAATNKIQFRRGSASDWTSSNPILSAGEPGYETDTGKVKVGDGTTAWTSLSYSSPIVNNATDNRILTSTGTTSGINAEANATFDGTTFAITGTSNVTGQFNIDNLRLDGNTLSSIDSNGNIIISSNGAGNINLTTASNTSGNIFLNNANIRIGNGSSTTRVMTTSDTSNLILCTNNDSFSSNITIQPGSFGNIIIKTDSGDINLTTGSNTTGNIFLNNANIRVGNGSSTTNITTTSTGSNLILSTNNNTSSANITIGAGSIGNILLRSFGTGTINLTTNTNTSGNIFLNNTNIRIGNGSTTTNLTTTSSTSSLVLATNNNTTSSNISIGAGSVGNIILTTTGTGGINLTTSTNTSGNININNTNLRIGNGSLTTNIFTTSSTSNLRLATNAGTSTAVILIGAGSSGNINLSTSTNTTGSIFLNSTNIRVGNGSTTTNITTTSNTSALTLSTNANSSSAKITINNGTNGNIQIISNGTGGVSIGKNHSISGSHSTAIGVGAATSLFGEVAHSSDANYGLGYYQHSILTAFLWTADDTPYPFTLDGQGYGSLNALILPTSTIWTFTITISAYDAFTDDGAGWIFRGSIVRDSSNTTRLIGTVIEESWKDPEMTNASVSITADNTHKALKITATGPAAAYYTYVYWTAVVDISQTKSGGTPP